MFQSTRPRGARHQGRVHGLVHCPVSIHAPAWGATDRPAPRRRRRSSFNPRARVGRDGAAVLRMVPLSMFQSTRPRGARRSGRPSAACTRCFNPRARVGRDARQRQNPEHHQSFNPRARVGRDGRSSGLPKRLTCFNPRARVGRDSRRWQRLCETASFNPRARVGRDSASAGCCRMAYGSFNPRARVGRDSVEWGWLRKRLSFNPRARVGRDPSHTSSPPPVRCFNPRARVGRDHFIAIRRFMS